MALNSKRVRLIAIIILCAILAIVALVWFVIAPTFLENYVNDMLAKVEAKTGRHIEINNIKLTGIKSASIHRVTISDVRAPERTGIALDGVNIALSAVPLNSRFSIQSVQIDEMNVHVRMAENVSNFDDILKKLTSKTAKDTDEAAKSAAWKRLITPLPAVKLERLAMTMPPVRVNDGLEISAVSAADLAWEPSQQEVGVYELKGRLSALLDESGTRTTYNTELSGRIQNREKGVISVTQPLSDHGLVPAVMRHDHGTVGFDTASWVLPTTFEVAGLHVTEGDKTLIHAEKTRARLMTLPPKKVSGVYFKEVELVRPQIHDYIRDDGSAIQKFAYSWGDAVTQGWGSAMKTAVQNKAAEMAVEAATGAVIAGIEAAAKGSETIVEDIAKGAVNGVLEKSKQPNLKDYFFSQRMFITDGQISVEDQRAIALASFKIDDIDLEVGYRSIRKVVDYLISCQIQAPLQTKLELNGVYKMDDEQVNGRFVIHPLRSTEHLHKTQAGLTAKNAENAEESDIWLKILPTLNLEKTVFEAAFDYDVRLKSQDVQVTTSLSLKDLSWSHDLISPEPIELSGTAGFSVSANLAQKQFSLQDVQIKTHGTNLALDLTLNREQRKTRARANRPSKLVDDWKFGLKVSLPQQPMQQLFDAIPHALRTELDGLTWQGTMGLDLDATGFLGALSETQHKFTLTRSEDFGVLTWPMTRDLMSLNHGFTHTVIDPNALVPHEIVIPPSIYPVTIKNLPVYVPTLTAENIRLQYPHWVLFDDLNPWLVQLITTTEDGSFFTHAGFSPLQIKAALEKNVNQQAFSRGASTISMQLVKNLFFERTKTISRKTQEVLYTWLMESVVQIPKQRIMELYFNIIEFGPEIYGIEEAAKYYFGKRSQDLSLKECAFLMSIIPNPRKGAIYRVQPTLERGIQKMMNFYIQEMYRRKCDPEVIAKMHEKYARMNKPVPFEPCCPPKDSLQLMIDNGVLAFYVPDPADTLKYDYLPELYTPDGSPLFERRETTCGYRGGELDGELTDGEFLEPANAIFEPFVPVRTAETPSNDSQI